MTVDILGTKWKIVESDREETKALKNCDGFCDNSINTIIIDRMDKTDDPFAKANLEKHKKKTIRHEIVHAFLYESGLAENFEHANRWGQEETMVDWIAMQGLKIYKAWEDAKAI